MDKAARVLDWRPRFDLESGVLASVPWLVEQGLLDPAETVDA
jgi:nucleoside-diphosphate-sugar epimerase